MSWWDAEECREGKMGDLILGHEKWSLWSLKCELKEENIWGKSEKGVLKKSKKEGKLKIGYGWGKRREKQSPSYLTQGWRWRNRLEVNGKSKDLAREREIIHWGAYNKLKIVAVENVIVLAFSFFFLLFFFCVRKESNKGKLINTSNYPWNNLLVI